MGPWFFFVLHCPVQEGDIRKSLSLFNRPSRCSFLDGGVQWHSGNFQQNRRGCRWCLGCSAVCCFFDSWVPATVVADSAYEITVPQHVGKTSSWHFLYLLYNSSFHTDSYPHSKRLSNFSNLAQKQASAWQTHRMRCGRMWDEEAQFSAVGTSGASDDSWTPTQYRFGEARRMVCRDKVEELQEALCNRR